MPEQISVAVIGAGMAGRSHAAAYPNVNTVFGQGLPPVRLAAIADANVALAEDGARRYGYEKAVPSWEARLTADRCGGVSNRYSAGRWKSNEARPAVPKTRRSTQ